MRLTWIMVNVGVFGFIAILHFPSDLPPNHWLIFHWESMAVGSVFGLVSGAIVGSAQASALRRMGRRVGWWWVWASAISVSIAHAMGDGFPQTLAFPLQVVGGGALLGLTQGLVWGRGSLSLGWAIHAAVGWIIGLSAGVWLVKTAGWDDLFAHVIVALITGLGVGLATVRVAVVSK